MGINKELRRDKKAKSPAGEPTAVVVQKIDVRPIHRTEQTIPNWRLGIQGAEAQNPRLWRLYTLYHDVALDGHVIAVTGKRFDAVTTANWQFVNKDNEAVDIINDIIDSIGFETIVREILNSKFWGYSILEPKFYKAHNENWEVSANLLPRLHYFPQTGVISYDGVSPEGVNIREGIYAKTVMEIGNPKDLGLFASAAQYQVLKRGGIGDYAMFVQVFGRPIIDATYDGMDDTQRQQLKQDLDIGAGGVIVRPDGTTIDVIESKGNQSTIHQDFKKDMNDEISKALLGSTETTESSDSSGYAQAETHSNSDDKKFSGDINFVRRYLNSRFIKILEAHGFDTEGGKFIVDDEQNRTKKEKLETLISAKKNFDIPVDDDYIYSITGIPKPDNYDKQVADRAKKEDKVPGINDPKKKVKKEPEEPKKKETKPIKKTTKNEEETEVKLMAKWWQDLKGLFLTAQAQTWATIGKHHTINLSFENSFNNDDYLKRIYKAEGNLEFDAELFKFTVKTLLKGFKSGWDKKEVKLNYDPSFVYNYDDPAMLTAFELNIFRFAGAKDLAEIQKLNDIFRDSSSFKEFYKKASKVTKIYNQDYLETEYNTAVLTGEAAASFNRLKQQADIFPYWEYKTAGDEHVRHSHKPLDGIILPANDPRWKKLFPPNGWNCRCYIVPRLPHEFDKSKLAKMRAKADAYLSSPAYAKEAAQGWGVNRGEIGEIFTANQQYVRKFKDNSSKFLNDLNAVNWKLKQYSNAKKVAASKAPEYKETAEDFYKKLEGDVVKELRDYSKRILTVEKKNFIRHSTGAKENRVTMLNAAVETLNDPDEVWAQGKEFKELIYLKYYTDKTLIVVGKLNGLKLEFRSWFNMFEKKKVIEGYRKGLLVKAKK